MSGSMSQDHYAVLDIAPTATPKEIKRAYQRLSMEWHPDKNEGSQEATVKMQVINAAWEVLGDEAQKREYDKTLKCSTNAMSSATTSTATDPRPYRSESKEKQESSPPKGNYGNPPPHSHWQQRGYTPGARAEAESNGRAQAEAEAGAQAARHARAYTEFKAQAQAERNIHQQNWQAYVKRQQANISRCREIIRRLEASIAKPHTQLRRVFADMQKARRKPYGFYQQSKTAESIFLEDVKIRRRGEINMEYSHLQYLEETLEQRTAEEAWRYEQEMRAWGQPQDPSVKQEQDRQEKQRWIHDEQQQRYEAEQLEQRDAKRRAEEDEKLEEAMLEAEYKEAKQRPGAYPAWKWTVYELQRDAKRAQKNRRRQEMEEENERRAAAEIRARKDAAQRAFELKQKAVLAEHAYYAEIRAQAIAQALRDRTLRAKILDYLEEHGIERVTCARLGFLAIAWTVAYLVSAAWWVFGLALWCVYHIG
ncbi:hypothetical protein NX059_003533 [Plenodomus lindquistii]|nr:hypothetical protein NX059_003533 [Plenodomus lindquistii]